MSEHLTAIEASQHLGITPHAVREALRLGLLPGGTDSQGRRYVAFDRLPPRYRAYLAPVVRDADLRAPVLPPPHTEERGPVDD